MPEAPGSPRQPETALTPELVRQVADRVYALWLQDLARMRERTAPRSRPRTGRLRRR